MAEEQPEDVRHEPPANGNQDVQPHLQLHLYDQRYPWLRRELTTPTQENQEFLGQATFSLPQTDGDQTIHQGVPVQFLPSSNRSGISQTRPFDRVQDHQDDLPLMSNEGIYYPPGAGSRSPQDRRFHSGMEVESAGEASHDRSVNPNGIQSVRGEQTLPLAEGERPRQLSDSDVSMESEEDNTTILSPQHVQDHTRAFLDSEHERERSFENGPAIFNSNTQLSAKTMAENGFFYMGVGDYVRCFKCDGVLHTWDQHDDPLVEHIRHGLPDICPYLVSTVDPNLLSAIIKEVQHIENGKLSCDIDETACKQHTLQDQLNLQYMSAASGNTAAFQSSSEMNNPSIFVTAPPEPYSDTNALSGTHNQNRHVMYRSQTSELTSCPVKTETKKRERQNSHNADEAFLCQDCRRNKVNHTQRDCGHGICGECISCMMGTPMNGRRCVTCNRPVIGYSSWAPNCF